ncbi:Ribokinase-like protein [Flagelloscypha sp. PMI_526]|nr:Ribokinase-like protein [Flagelloscypha sp. PMI_526]
MNMAKESLKLQIKKLIPPLNGTLHKGQSGRVAVLGGAQDYSGAPFFAAIAAQRVGADLSHVICSPTAAGSIKSYSPDLIVHPILRPDKTPSDVKSELSSILSRIHALVLGPGLGREPYMQEYAKSALDIAKNNGTYIVLDADGLLLATEDHALIRGYRRAVLTPNVVEFKRLAESLGLKPEDGEGVAGLVSKELGGVTILQKGAKDVIAVDTTGENADSEKSRVTDNAKEELKDKVIVDTPGGLKRCGGQGDILSGAVGTFLSWGKCYEDGAYGDKTLPISRIPLLAAVGASMTTRTTSRIAFSREGRGVVTQDMLPDIGKAFAEVFGEELQGSSKL